MRVYIAGKISGLDYLKARRTFEIAETSLMARGYEVVNPMKLCGENWPWKLCMVVCLLALMRCRCVCLLPGWETSRGAKIEKRFAEFLGRGVYTYIPEQKNSGE